MAVRALADWRAGAMPDPRIHMSTRTDGRDIAVLLLVMAALLVVLTMRAAGVAQLQRGADGHGEERVLDRHSHARPSSGRLRHMDAHAYSRWRLRCTFGHSSAADLLHTCVRYGSSGRHVE